MTRLDSEDRERRKEGARIGALDVLRGFALCGIIFINIPQTLDMVPPLSAMPDAMRILVHERFYPIFYFLFGIGFGIFLRSARERTPRPRTVLARRLVVLMAFGGLHHLLQPGEVLLWFGLTGLVVLLPLSLLTDRRARLAVAVVLTVVGIAIGVGGLGLLPGLFALGFATADYRVPDSLAERTGQIVALLVVSAVVATGLDILLRQVDVPQLVSRGGGLLAATATAATYGCLVVLALRTPVGGVLKAVLAPMGRLALTNYLTATVAFVVVGRAIGLAGSTDFGRMALLATSILLVQAVWSWLWLRAFRYGPMEWIWRCLTWWEPVPNRRLPAARHA